MFRKLLLAGVAVAVATGLTAARADEEPPDAQARAVAALGGARVLDVVSPPPLTLVGLGTDKALSGQVSGLDRAMRELGARVVGREVRIDLAGDVLFDFDKAAIRPDAERMLAMVAEVIRAHPGARVRVEGHTDSVGDAAYNLALSERRAGSVKEWLGRQEGLAGTSFEVRGLGETRPAAPNSRPDGSDDPVGRARNRRVELVITQPG